MVDFTTPKREAHRSHTVFFLASLAVIGLVAYALFFDGNGRAPSSGVFVPPSTASLES